MKKINDYASYFLVGSKIETSTRGLHTEEEDWNPTKLAILNAVLDTLIPGARFVFEYDQDGKVIDFYITDFSDIDSNVPSKRPRNISQSLRDLADNINE